MTRAALRKITIYVNFPLRWDRYARTYKINWLFCTLRRPHIFDGAGGMGESHKKSFIIHRRDTPRVKMMMIFAQIPA
jgi:hypothetical protein